MGIRYEVECPVNSNVLCDIRTRDCERCSIHRNPDRCLVNPSIDCAPNNRDCDHCGWNPIENYRRKEKLKALEQDKS